MLNCEQFRFLVGADPVRLSFTQRLHWLTCLGCARYLRTMRRLNRTIRQALLLPNFEIGLSGSPAGRAMPDGSGRRRPH